MPSCRKARCKATFDTPSELHAHMKTHRKPRPEIKPRVHTCHKCGREIPTPFAHFNSCM